MKIAHTWQLRSQCLTFDKIPALMGIVNVTPDSFSDGGNYFEPNRAVDHALQLVSDGAVILDVGGESTRPYSEPVAASEEIQRVIPVIKKIVAQTKIPVSVDTSKVSVARAALDVGAEIINDVTGLTGDPEMIELARESGAGVCAMHMQGNPQIMQDNPRYENVIQEIFGYLALRQQALLDAGIQRSKICLDPGIGFGKTHEHNIELVKNCQQFHELGVPIVIGHSRKGFIANILGDKEMDRDSGTLAVTLILAQKQIQIVRVHEVARTMQALKVWVVCR